MPERVRFCCLGERSRRLPPTYLSLIHIYELKTAVGTSVFIMTFTALTGAVSHFMIGGTPDWLVWGCLLYTSRCV